MKKRIFWPKKNGFTLIEIIFATAIFSLFLATVMRLIFSSRQNLALSSNSFSAIHVSSKVMTDLFEEARINASFIETLKEFPEMTSKDKIVEGQSIYFRYIKDKKPPWGKIEPSIEEGLSPSDGLIYSKLNSFRLSVDAKRLDTPDSISYEKHLAQATINTDWDEKSNAMRSYSLSFIIPNPVGPKPFEGTPFDETELPERIQEFFFPDCPNMPLEQVISEKHLDRELVLGIGKMYVTLLDLTNVISAYKTEIKNLISERKLYMTSPSPKLIEKQIAIARKAELCASLIYNALVELNPSIKKIKERATPKSMALIDYDLFSWGLGEYKNKSEEMFGWVQNAGEEYAWLLSDGLRLAISAREKELARDKVLEVQRLMFATGKNSPAAFKQYLKNEKEIVDGKNPFLQRLYIREERLVGNPAGFKLAFPNLKAISEKLAEINEQSNDTPQILSQHPFYSLSSPPQKTGNQNSSKPGLSTEPRPGNITNFQVNPGAKNR